MKLVLLSTLLAAAALLVALQLTRPLDADAYAGERLAGTPERAAESFIEAYRSGAYERAAHFATGALAEQLRAQARTQPQPDARLARARETLIVHESHRMEQQRLRLVGVVLRDGQHDERQGTSVSLTLHKPSGRYLVEEISW
jgi:hypothetical protein